MKCLTSFLFILLFITDILTAQHSGHEQPTPDDMLHQHKKMLLNAYLETKSREAVSSPQRQYDALYYRLDLEIEYNPNLLKGMVTGRFVSQADPLNSIFLDMDERLEISQVSGNLRSYRHENRRVIIELDRNYGMGEEFEVTISYTGVPGAGTGYNYFRFDTMDDGSPHVWTLSEPYGARYWWPCKDTPKDKPDSVDIVITVPAGQKVASNGILKSTIQNEDGTVTFHWFEGYPIATYLVSLAIGEYAQFQDYYISPENDTLLLDYYVYPSRLETARSAFSEMDDYLDALSHYFGPYPFMKEKYGMAQFGWVGGMEHQTITSIGRVSPDWRYVYVHELGHQWFGDAVTCDSWEEIWLNEGFASYSEALYAEWAGFGGYPPGKEALHAYMTTQTFVEGGTIIREDTTSFGSLFNLIVYDKAAWVLHMLRRIVGDDHFFTILKAYVSDPRWSYASVKTENFLEICETISGIDLETFFQQWLYYPYFPEYAYSWKVTGRSAGHVNIELTVRQRQNTIIYDMPLDIAFTFPSGEDTTLTVVNNRSDQLYTFRFREEPEQMHFDPDNWILKQVEEFIDAEFTSDVLIEEFYPNPFNNEINIVVRNWFFNKLTLHIYDITGRKIRELGPVSSSQERVHEFRWDGRSEEGRVVASGVYFVVPAGDDVTGAQAGKIVKIR